MPCKSVILHYAGKQHFCSQQHLPSQQRPVHVHVDSEFELSVGLPICCFSSSSNRNYWQICATSVTHWPNVTARIYSRAAEKPTLVKSAATSHWPMCTFLGGPINFTWTWAAVYWHVLCVHMCTSFVINLIEGVSGFTTHFAVRQAVVCWRTHHTTRQLMQPWLLHHHRHNNHHHHVASR